TSTSASASASATSPSTVGDQREENIVGVVAQRRSEKGQIGGDVGVECTAQTGRGQDRVPSRGRIGAVLRLHLHGGVAIECRHAAACKRELVILPRGAGIDPEDRAGGKVDVALHAQ